MSILRLIFESWLLMLIVLTAATIVVKIFANLLGENKHESE